MVYIDPDVSESDLQQIARREERKTTNWIATIRLPDGREIPTMVRDISPSGARLGVPENVELPENFMFRVIGRDFICAVQLAWRRRCEAGVRIARIGKLPAASKMSPDNHLKSDIAGKALGTKLISPHAVVQVQS